MDLTHKKICKHAKLEVIDSSEVYRIIISVNSSIIELLTLKEMIIKTKRRVLLA